MECWILASDGQRYRLTDDSLIGDVSADPMYAAGLLAQLAGHAAIEVANDVHGAVKTYLNGRAVVGLLLWEGS